MTATITTGPTPTSAPARDVPWVIVHHQDNGQEPHVGPLTYDETTALLAQWYTQGAKLGRGRGDYVMGHWMRRCTPADMVFLGLADATT